MKLAALTLTLLAGVASAGQPTLSLTTANKVQSVAGVSAYSLGAGSSTSTASGFQTATSYAAGSGGLSSQNSTQRLSLADCAPAQRVYGTLITGGLSVNGFTSVAGSADAQNVSTGAGTGSAEAIGLATATATGVGALTNKSFDMNVDGSAAASVLTHAIAEFNQVGTSAGHTSASFNSATTGSLFTFATPAGLGDVKVVTVDLKARAGDLTCTTGCGGTKTDLATSVNATIEAGATGTASTTITVVKP